MGHIDNKEIKFLSEQILKRHKIWYKEKYGHSPVNSNFTSYLPSYSTLCQSFDDIIGEGKVKDHTLRNLFYYAKDLTSTWFNTSILDSFYLYFSGKTQKEFYQGGLKNKLFIQINEIFESEFLYWKTIDSEYYIDHGLLKKIVKLIDLRSLDEERKAFVIVNSVHFGDESIHELILSNKNNIVTLFPLFRIAISGGIREGLRAEYFLSKMNHNILIPFLYQEEKRTTDPVLIEKINRIKTSSVKEHLLKIQLDGGKLADFASQVLKQLEA